MPGTEGADPPDFAYEALPSLAEEAYASPDLLGSENYEWGAIANLDHFFTRIYRYYDEKGFWVIALSRVLNLLALAFTIAFSAFLLLYVDWSALRSECIAEDTCDISEVAIRRHPFEGGVGLWGGAVCVYLGLLALYWCWVLAHLAADLRGLAETRHFVNAKLGVSERAIKTITWPEVARRIVDAQRTTRLCIARDLTEHDVVSRIMRKENYLIAMLNKGVLALNVPLPGLRKRVMLTKTLEWNLHWCLLDCMFDDTFHVRPAFLADEAALRRRFRRMAVANLLVSPFVLVFLLIYFFLRNAEHFYHHPSAVGARRWSSLAKWRLREFNELPHYITHRLNASHRAAEKYITQFPSPGLTQLAKCVAFVAGSFAALLLGVTLVDDALLERRFGGRTLVWWAALLGIILAISRAFIQEVGTAFDPELAMLEVVAHTHYLPRHWRGRCHTREVQEQFEQLFQFKALLFLEELASIVLTPFVLWTSLPACAPAILRFVADFTVHVDGVGDICSLAAFDFQRHGNSKYGAPVHAPKAARSRQGKMEKSFLSFAATYPHWEPDAASRQMLASVCPPGAPPPPPAPHFPHTTLVTDPHLVTPGAFAGPGRYLSYAQSALGQAAHRQHHLPGASHPTPARAAAISAHGSVFGSAELTAASTWAGAPGSHLPQPELERVAFSQAFLQSHYEEQLAASQQPAAAALLPPQPQAAAEDLPPHSRAAAGHPQRHDHHPPVHQPALASQQAREQQRSSHPVQASTALVGRHSAGQLASLGGSQPAPRQRLANTSQQAPPAPPRVSEMSLIERSPFDDLDGCV